MTLKILIAEDHTLVSEGLAGMLGMDEEMELVGVVTTGDAAVDAVQSKDVDLVLMDVNLGRAMNGLEATKRIKAEKPATKVLMLSMFTDPGTVTEAVKAGADGYLSKGSSREAVVQAIHDVVEGRSVLDPKVTEGVLRRVPGRDPTALRDRELEVLQHLTEGMGTKEIAEALGVSEETVKTYLKQIYRKLNAKDRTEAVSEAFRKGLVH